MVTEGNLVDIKNAIVTHISEADSSLLPKAEHVFSKWGLDVWETDTDKMPVVTVRVGPANLNETAYGRMLSNSKQGTYATFYFTAHVHHTIASGTEPSTTVMNLADKIITKLEKSDDVASGIVHYDGITYREASGMHHGLARVIIEGYVFVRRPF